MSIHRPFVQNNDTNSYANIHWNRTHCVPGKRFFFTLRNCPGTLLSRRPLSSHYSAIFFSRPFPRFGALFCGNRSNGIIKIQIGTCLNKVIYDARAAVAILIFLISYSCGSICKFGFWCVCEFNLIV